MEENTRSTPSKEEGNTNLMLLPFVEVFVRHGVEALVIGGQAEYLMGSARLTFDTDYCYRRSRENLERLAAALIELNVSLRDAPPDLPFKIDANTLALGSNFTFNTEHGPFDLLGWVEPIGGDDELQQSSEAFDFHGHAVRTISLADLIRVKEYIRRDKDREALAQLYAIRRRREQQD